MRLSRGRVWLILAMTLLIAGCRNIESSSRADIGGLNKPLAVVLAEFAKWGGCIMRTPPNVLGISCNLQGDGFERLELKDKEGKAFAGQPYSVQLFLRTSDEDEGKVSPSRRADIVRFVEYFRPDWPEASPWLTAAIDKVNRGKLGDCPEFIRVRGVAVMIQKDMGRGPGEWAAITITKASNNKHLTTFDVFARCNLCGYNKFWCLMN